MKNIFSLMLALALTLTSAEVFAATTKKGAYKTKAKQSRKYQAKKKAAPAKKKAVKKTEDSEDGE